MSHHVICACGAKLKFTESQVGQIARCPRCDVELTLLPIADQASSSEPDRTNQDKSRKQCPYCHALMTDVAVLCVQCGFDLRSKKRLLEDSPPLGRADSTKTRRKRKSVSLSDDEQREKLRRQRSLVLKLVILWSFVIVSYYFRWELIELGHRLSVNPWTLATELERFDSPSPSEWNQARGAISKLGTGAVPSLFNVIRRYGMDGNSPGSVAFSTIYDFKDGAGFYASRRIRHPDDNVRRAATAIMGHVCDRNPNKRQGIRYQLMPLLLDPNERIRHVAKGCIWDGPFGNVPPDNPATRAEIANTLSFGLRPLDTPLSAWSVELLYELKEPALWTKSLPAVREISQRHSVIAVRVLAARALIQAGEQPPTEQPIDQDAEFIWAAATSLESESQVSDDVLSPLITGSQDSRDEVRLIAADALTRRLKTNPSLVSELVRLLDDPNERVSRIAYFTLASHRPMETELAWTILKRDKILLRKDHDTIRDGALTQGIRGLDPARRTELLAHLQKLQASSSDQDEVETITSILKLLAQSVP